MAEINCERVGLFYGSNGKSIIIAGGFDSNTHQLIHSIDLLNSDIADNNKWESVHWAGARAWGATVQFGNDIILIGGVDSSGKVSSVVTRIHLNESNIEVHEMVSLPYPIAASGAAVIGNTLYVVCGLRSLDADHAENSLWALELTSLDAKWCADRCSYL